MIDNHRAEPQQGSNLCVCGEPLSSHDPIVSFRLESNMGSLPILLCACGALIYQPMGRRHIDVCDVYRADGGS